MLIGGYDLSFPTPLPAHEALEVATNAIMGFWKEGLVEVEAAKNSAVVDPYIGKLPEAAEHIFIYKSKVAYEAWEAEGWNETWAYGMIYLSMYSTELNCVLENPEDPRLKPLVEAIKKAVQHELP